MHRWKFRAPRAPALVLALLATLMLAPLAPARAADCPAPTPAEAEAIARAYFDAFNKGDRDALDKLLAPDYRQKGAIMDQDRALHLDRLLAVRKAFPDGVYTIDWIIADGDMVVIRHTFRGTHLGEYTGVAPSGNKVSVGAFHVHRIECGKIAETWNAGDGIGLFRQIGALKGPPTTGGDEQPPAPAKPASMASCPDTTPSENAAAARRWYDEALNQGRFEALDEILAADDVHHAGVFPDTVGREPTKASLVAIRTAFPDIHFAVDGVVASGDKVLIRWTGKGTQKGAFIGVPATGKGVEWSGMNAFRFACGKIIEGWSEANGLSILRQLGAFP